MTPEILEGDRNVTEFLEQLAETPVAAGSTRNRGRDAGEIELGLAKVAFLAE